MKYLACTFVLVCTVALCGCAANVSTSSSPGKASSASVKTPLFAGTSWSQSVKTILAQNKAAMGGSAWDHIHSLRTESTVKMGGLSGSVTSLNDLLTGSSVQHINLGPIEISSGYNGKVGWKKLPNGEASSSSSPVAKKANLTKAYHVQHAWWYPKRWPAQIISLGMKKANGETFQILKITPKGGSPFKMWIDTKTHLITRTVDHDRNGLVTTSQSDFRTVDGLKFPFHTKIVIGKGLRTIIAQLKSVSVNVPVNPQDFAIPEQHTNNIAIIGGGNKATIPFKLIGNSIHIQVTVNGHPFHFIVDSGGMDVLTPKAAKALGLAGQGALEAGGAGPKSVKSRVSKVKSLVLGGKVTLRNQLFAIVPFPQSSSKTPIAGTVGYGVFKNFVVRIDYAHQRLTLIRPADFKPASATTAIPISFFERVPAVEGSLDGLKGLFLVDTGTGFSLILNAPFSRAHDLYSRYHATPPFALGQGYNGKVTTRIARGAKLQLGAVTIHNPVIALSTATKGFLANKQVAGILGVEVFKRFTMTLDYANNRMYLQPNKNYGTPMNFNRTGISTKQTKRGLVVFGVMKDGPGAEAGIRVGDVITAVNGKPASQIKPNEFSQRMKNEAPGTKVKFTIGEGKSAHTVTITLRRLIPKTGGLKKAA